MHCNRSTAEQLGSVARRYRPVTLPASVWSRGRHGWWERIALGSEARQEDTTTDQHRQQRVEAVLLLAREPLNSRKLAHHAGLADGTQARTLVRRLNALYDRAGRAFRVEEIAGGFRLLTRRQFAPWLRRLAHIPSEERLSAPSMETLAVVAYRQPVLRAEIEAVRGVGCGEILRQLMERDLVRIGGRSDELGRPYLYTTTKRFLQLFGLQGLDHLPRAGVLRNLECPEDRPDQPSNASMSTDDSPQEERSEVNVPSPAPTLPEFPLGEALPGATAAPAHDLERAEAFEDEVEEFDDDDEIEDDLDEDDLDYDDDEEFDDEFDEEEEYDDDEYDDDDELEESEWEEVDDDDEIEEEWDEDDEDWDDDDDEDEDEDDDEDEAEDEAEDEDGEDWDD